MSTLIPGIIPWSLNIFEIVLPLEEVCFIVSSNKIIPLIKSLIFFDVKRASRKFNLFASVEGIFTESNLLVIVLLLSSAAKIPLPFSTIARAIDSMLFIELIF